MMSAPLKTTITLLAFSTIFVSMTGCGITDAGRPFPPTELLWSKGGFSRTDVDSEMANCAQQLRLHPELKTYVQQTNVVDTCMLKKGFTFIPSPQGWMNVCGSAGFSETVGCKSARGELVIPPDETALQIKPDPLVKPKSVPSYIECRKDKPKYEAAYCECSLRTRYEKPDPCAHLLKYQDRSVDKQVGPSTEKTEPETIAPTVTPSDQVLRENLKELQRAQDKTQIKPYTPPTNLPVIPQAPNPRLEKLLKGR
jgi:hypothetical protein